MKVSIDKKRQDITIALKENGMGRWAYDITAIAKGDFPYLKEWQVTRLDRKPFNYDRKGKSIKDLKVVQSKKGGFTVITEFYPEEIVPGSKFNVNISFDLGATWDNKNLRFYEKLAFDCPSSLEFILPSYLDLQRANVHPDEKKKGKDGRMHLKWTLHKPAVYEFDFTMEEATNHRKKKF